MKMQAKCLSVQIYSGFVSVDSGKVTTNEMGEAVQEFDANGAVSMVARPKHPAGAGHPIFVNELQTMYRVNFVGADLPAQMEVTISGLTKHVYEEGKDYTLELTIA